MLIPERTDRSFRRRIARRAAARALTIAALVLLVVPITADRAPHSRARWRPDPRNLAVLAAPAKSARARAALVDAEGRPR